VYQTFVMRALIYELLQVLAPVFFFAVIYFGAGLYKEEYRGCALAVLGLFFGGVLLLALWVCYPVLYDCVQYLRQGEAYVQDDSCRLTDVSSGIGLFGLVFPRDHLYCQGNQEFVSLYRRDYQRVLWRWAREGRTLHVRYLPRSRLVLELMPEESP
jgi:hypothetical protein